MRGQAPLAKGQLRLCSDMMKTMMEMMMMIMMMMKMIRVMMMKIIGNSTESAARISAQLDDDDQMHPPVQLIELLF